jgi:hypothetical protein
MIVGKTKGGNPHRYRARASYRRVTRVYKELSGIEALFPGTTEARVDIDELCACVLRQAGEGGVDINGFFVDVGRFLNILGPYVTVPPEFEIAAQKIGTRLKIKDKRKVILVSCLLLLLHREHTIRYYLGRAVAEGDHVALKNTVAKILDCTELGARSYEEFLSGG